MNQNSNRGDVTKRRRGKSKMEIGFGLVFDAGKCWKNGTRTHVYTHDLAHADKSIC